MRVAPEIVLTEDERAELMKLTSSRLTSVRLSQRARIVLLAAEGMQADHVVAFARRAGNREVVVLAPRLTARLTKRDPERLPIGDVWDDTVLPVAEGRFVDVLTGRTVLTEEGDAGPVLRLDAVLREFPVALLDRAGEEAPEP